MNVPILIARALHIGAGVFWAGSMMFNAQFLIPAMQEAGPAAGAVMAGLEKRKMLQVIPAAALVTILSGLWLLGHVSGGFQGSFMGSPQGITLSVGAVGAIVALLIGLMVMRPAMLKAGALTQEAMKKPESERGPLMAEAGQLRAKMAKASKLVSAGIGIAVLAMALARYLG